VRGGLAHAGAKRELVAKQRSANLDIDDDRGRVEALQRYSFEIVVSEKSGNLRRTWEWSGGTVGAWKTSDVALETRAILKFRQDASMTGIHSRPRFGVVLSQTAKGEASRPTARI
jgi:hypothetical protein